MILVGPRGRRDLDLGDRRSAAHGLSFRGDQSVAEAEGPQTGRVGGMALGPGGGKAEAFGDLLFPAGEDHGGNRFDPCSRKRCHQVFPEFHVRFFAEDPRPGPAFRRQAAFLPEVGFGLLHLGQDPADDGQLPGFRRRLGKGHLKRLQGHPVKSPDVLFFILLVDRVLSAGKSNQRIVPGFFPGRVLQGIRRRSADRLRGKQHNVQQTACPRHNLRQVCIVPSRRDHRCRVPRSRYRNHG